MRRAAAVWSLALAGSLTLLAGSASAQEGIFAGMQKSLDTVFSSVSTKTTLASGQVVRTETQETSPALTLNLDALLYPNLRVNAGGVFEVSMFSVTGDNTDASSTISRNRPFFLLRSTNPVFSPGVGYFRRVERSRTRGLSDVKLVNDEYAGYLGWNPAGGPRSDFQVLRTNTFDGARAFQDITRDFGSLVSSYTYRNLGAYYRGTYVNTDDRIEGIETRQLSQGGRVTYAGTYIQKRLAWNATYNINHDDVRTTARGTGGEVALPVVPFAGLSALSDTPVTARLTDNRPLIDGNITAGAGVDLGLAVPPEDLQSRNIGLDFLNRTEVNRLHIWVDRPLPVEVANAFSWEIYSSPDNLIWRRETVVSAAPFGPFENRFEVDFTSVTARYLKVVTRPLSAVVPDASRFPDILVTEVQPFLRRPAEQGSSRLARTTHLINTDVRMRILDTPSLFYEGFYLYNGPDSFGTSTNTLSNGVSVSHMFNRVFSVYARGAREQGTQPEGDRVATLTNATLTVDPISTLRTSLLYTGQDERIDGTPLARRGFFVQNAGQPYRGVDVLFGFGWNFNSREAGEESRDRLVNLSATVVPRQHVSLTVSYDGRTTERSGTFFGEPRSTTRRLYAAVGFDPIRTLHLVLGEEVLVISGQRTRTTLDVGVNWAPFQDGTLQFVFASNQAMRSLEYGNERNTVGGVRWNVSRRSYIDVSYQRTRSEFDVQKVESRIFSVSVRFFF